MDSISIEIVLIAVGIVANGFFAGSEIALVSARISRLAELREQAVRGAAAAMRLREKPEAAGDRRQRVRRRGRPCHDRGRRRGDRG